jgi:hypothetical protein
MQDKLSEGLVDGFPSDVKTVVRLRRLLSQAEKLRYDLGDEAVRQCEAHRDANEALE